MSEERKHIEFEEEQPKERQPFRGPSMREIIDGSLLTRQNVIKQLPFILFITLLAALYIGNRYHAEKLTRLSTSLERDLKDLRSEYITTAAELMNISKQSKVIELINEHNLELEQSTEPPIKISVSKKELE
jgi:hypothetical protein